MDKHWYKGLKEEKEARDAEAREEQDGKKTQQTFSFYDGTEKPGRGAQSKQQQGDFHNCASELVESAC